MKNKFLVLFVATTLGLGVACTVLWRQLQAERARARAAQAAGQVEAEARAAQENQLDELERSRARLERNVQELGGLATDLRAKEAGYFSNLAALATQTKASGSGQAGTNSGSNEGGLFGKGMGDMFAKMMKDPEMRKMMRTQQRAAVNMMYGGLLKELNLSPEQKDKFMELLLDTQMKSIEQAQVFFDKEKASGDSEIGGSLNEQKKQADEQIRALLGDEKFAQYEDYQKHLGERLEINQLRTQLDAAGLPLHDSQAAQLLAAMQEEKARVPPAIPDTGGQFPKDTSVFTAENLNKQLQWMEAYNQRVRERAMPILTPEQLQQFKEFQDQQAAMQRLGMKMVGEMFGSGKNSDPQSKEALK